MGSKPLAEQLVGLAGPLVVAVSGSRFFSDYDFVEYVLGTIDRTVPGGIQLLIEGECPVDEGGLDELARLWAKHNEVNYLGVPPKSKKYGWPRCGPLRNREIAEKKPGAWVIFPGGRGTASAREMAQEFQIKIIDVS